MYENSGRMTGQVSAHVPSPYLPRVLDIMAYRYTDLHHREIKSRPIFCLTGGRYSAERILRYQEPAGRPDEE